MWLDWKDSGRVMEDVVKMCPSSWQRLVDHSEDLGHNPCEMIGKQKKSPLSVFKGNLESCVVTRVWV